MLFRQLKPSLRNLRYYYTVKSKPKRDEFYVARQIYQRIKVKGPLTISDYMKEVLTNPMSGYYMHKDMFGETGDFITSPEVSQMFGEMIGVWLVNEWQKMGSPTPVQIVELGPGRGTLSYDILKVFNHFNALHCASLKLIEISPVLSDIQAKKLCVQSFNCSNCEKKSPYKKGTSHHKIPVEWYLNLKDIPNEFSLIVAHEFFDALPIHKFQKSYAGYREVLVDIDPEVQNDNSENFEPKFRYVLSREHTPMSKILIKPTETREHLEICVDAILICQEMAKRIKTFGGVALICDYGHFGTDTDTFRAYKKHQQVDPLVLPGSADLTADVDFKLIQEAIKEKGGVITYGPITQRDFLLRIGIEHRLKSLMEYCKNDRQKMDNLRECFDMLVSKNKMGERFKFFSIFPETIRRILDKFPAIGFT